MNKLAGKGKGIARVLLAALMVGALVVPAALAAGPTWWPPTLRVIGSTTTDFVVQHAITPFQTAWAGTVLERGAPGSGAGITQLLADTNDIAPSSRAANATERFGIDPPPGTPSRLNEYLFGRDALAIIVRNVPAMAFLTNITIAQVDFIYERGAAITTTTWHDVDMVDGVDHWVGDAHLVVPRARVLESGTQPSFLSLFGVTGATEITTINATGLPRIVHSSEIVTAIAATDFAISYVGLGYIDSPGVRAVPIGLFPGVMPSLASLADGTYPATRNLFLITRRGDPTPNARADDFINYMFTAAGQAHVAAEGFAPVTPVVPMIADFDVNKDGAVNIFDITGAGAISANWALENPAHRGWIRADVNNDGVVNLFDITGAGAISANWGWTGPAH